MEEKLERIVKFFPAYDKRHSDPKKNYGVGCVRVIMLLKGKKGAVSFTFGTGMYLPRVYEWWESKGLRHGNKPDYMGYDVGYHSPTPKFEGQDISQKKCDWIGAACYSDGSAIRADDYMKVLLEKGDEKIWNMLEKDYKNHLTDLE